MNHVVMIGRLTRDPDTKYGGSNNTCIAKFALAVDRRFKKEGQPTADFFECTAFGKTGEFVEKYLHKGTKIAIQGEIQNNNYTNRNGQKVYAMNILVNQVEFAESKKVNDQAPDPDNDFLDVSDADESDIPFA